MSHRFRFLVPLLLAVLAGTWPGGAAAAELVVQSARFWQAPDNTRVVFDLSAAPEFSTSTLSGPERIVIDLKNAKLGFAPDKLAIQSNLVKQLRDGVGAEGKSLRLVLDLSGPFELKAFALKPYGQYGDRLVLDIRDLGKADTGAAVPANEPAKTDAARDLVIAIDAGHGGDDPGAVGAKGTYEKDVTLAIAKKLAEKINQQKGMKAYLTRSADYFVPLRKRTLLARQQRADLFVSIHADSFKDKRASGASVWVLSQRGAQSEMGHWLEEKENASDLLGGEDALNLAKYDDDVAKVLLDLSMYNAVGSSLDIGSHVLGEMKGVVAKLHKPSVQQAGFIVLKNPDIPAILVETAFLSNPKEEALLKTKDYQDKLASAIFKGVNRYFEKRPPDGSSYAQHKQSRHVVSRGETLSAVATTYDVSLKALREKNALKSDTVRVGQVLVIP